MQSSTGHVRCRTIPVFLALPLALTVILGAGCGDAASPTGPGPSGTPPGAGAPAPGSIQVSVTTTGVELDPDGYVVGIDNSISFPTPVRVNDTVVIRGVPAGGHTATLYGIAPNCIPADNYRGAMISDGSGAAASPSVSFTVTCFTRSIPPALAATQLLFVSYDPMRGPQLYRTRADGTGLVDLGVGTIWGFAAWSPDGQRIAFPRDSGVYVTDADGAHVQRVPGVAACPWAVTWSPDGRRLAVASGCEDGPSQITVVPLDGASAPVIIPDSWSPAWSPDGSRIAFGATIPGTDSEAVWTVAPDGSDRKLLIRHSESGLAWSPDGKQLALGGGSGIWVMNADGSGLRVLTNLPGQGPTWSPDGQAIAFSAFCFDCTRSVFYVTADGSTTGLLIENADNPSWHK